MSKYYIGGLEFSSKAAIKSRVQGILKSYAPGTRLAGGDKILMFDLLHSHPNHDQKVGCGVAEIFVRTFPPYNTKGFYLERLDGTGTDFSYNQCLQPATQRADFVAACRVAVAPAILAFKQEQFRQSPTHLCPISGESLTWDNVHVDHAPPLFFSEIVRQFIKEYDISICKIKIGGRGRDGETTVYFEDAHIAKQFVAFHDERAALRLLSPRANIELGRSAQ